MSQVFHLLLNSYIFIASCIAQPISYRKFRGNIPETNATFIHIPKTGGTTITTILLEKNIRVGVAAFWLNFQGHGDVIDKHVRSYKVIKTHPNDARRLRCNNKPTNALRFYINCKLCSRWHTPPLQYIPNSFVIIRDPLSRLHSKFLFCFLNSMCCCY